MVGLPVIFVGILALAVSMGGRRKFVTIFSIYLRFKRIRVEKMEKKIPSLLRPFRPMFGSRFVPNFRTAGTPKNKLRTIRQVLRE